MNEYILSRKSVRKFDMQHLSNIAIQKVQAKIKELMPLYPDLEYSIEITDKTKGVFNVKAPHYLVFRSLEQTDDAFANIGFLGQQMDHYFHESGLGSCWLGMAKPDLDPDDALPYVVSIAFGKPEEPLTRNKNEFKRKALSDISIGNDPRLEAARLAPSGRNAQGWFFIARKGEINCYRKKAGPILSQAMNRMSAIDMGIAMYHIALESENFIIRKEDKVPDNKGFIYMGTIE